MPWQDHAAASEWDGPGAAFSDIACVMNTSGTTGPAKGMLMPHAHCTLFGIGSIRCLALTSEDRFYVSLPFSTPTGC